MILNLDQTPLAYLSTPNHTLEVKWTTSIPIVGKGKNSKLPVHSRLQKMGLCCQCSSYMLEKRSTSQGIEFPQGFDVTSTPNHWSNEEKINTSRKNVRS